MQTDNSRKVILDLCGGTGSWSKPYADAGYDVRIIDPQVWLNGHGGTGDVRLFEAPPLQSPRNPCGPAVHAVRQQRLPLVGRQGCWPSTGGLGRG